MKRTVKAAFLILFIILLASSFCTVVFATDGGEGVFETVSDGADEIFYAEPSSNSVFISSSGLKLTRFITGGVWTNLPYSNNVDHMEGVQFQTNSAYFYFEYRVKFRSTGWSNWYVSTNNSAYPGASGQAVTNIQIKVYNNITKSYDYTDYVVMYRTRVAGEWLDWVSNGSPDVMQTIKSEFSLSGNLDTAATDSGWASRGNITALQVMMYERRSRTASAGAMLIDAPYINQTAVGLPSGCESVSAVMALRYAGVNIDTETFVSRYLPKGNAPSNGVGSDPSLVYVGDPHLTGGLGWGCYASVITDSVRSAAGSVKYHVTNATGSTLSSLCSAYIDNNVPVIIWATVGMTRNITYSYWSTPGGKSITYINQLHSLLLVGYDNEYYYFNDPMKRVGDNKYFAYSRSSVEAAYTLLGKQAVVIEKLECTGVTLKALPSVTSYIAGEKFDSEGFALTAQYSDGTNKNVSGFTFSGYDMSRPGTQNVEYTYTDPLGGTFYGTFTITVFDANETLAGVKIVSLPERTEYVTGDELDLAGAVFNAVYEYYCRENGAIVLKSVSRLAEDCVVTGFDSTLPGTCTVVISIGAFSDSFEVTVKRVIVRGDATGDGEVDMKDVLLCRKLIALIAEDDDVIFDAADAQRDGYIDMKDVAIIIKIMIGSGE
ncbi:MAG: C39 family peptidase [Clostridia bacterium]|nr:C39 family peptidase [Clostridia bacterium]